MTTPAEQTLSQERKTEEFVRYFTSALKLHESGDLDKAIAGYRTALAFKPDDATAHTNIGVALFAQGKLADATTMQQAAVKLDPTSSISFNNLGVVLNAQHRYLEAVEAYARACALDPSKSSAFSNHGDALNNAGRYDEAAVQIQKALWLKPDYAEAHSNLGMSYWGMGRLDAAIAALRVALALNPKLAMARKNLGIVLLLCGRYAEGWQEYDWRWQADHIPFRFSYPLWLGQKIEGELLLWAEQGPGDEILQSSMIEDLLLNGLKIVWECDKRLVPLIQRSYPTVRVVPRQTPPRDMGPNIKAHLPAGSLGHVVRPDASRFPMNRQGHLKADPERTAALRAIIAPAAGKIVVGISWFSRNLVFGEKKSTKLSEWADILRTPGCKFVNLQYGDTGVERGAFTQETGLPLTHIDGLDLRDDLDGLAALVAACDQVITVSNTTAHIAGALGVPAWILVASGGGKLWYWGTETVETPAWYPSARIIRQGKDQPWAASLKVAAERLVSLAL